MGVSWHMKYYFKIIFICYIKVCLHTWIYINEMKGFVGTIYKWGILCAIHMLRDTPGGGVVSWHMKYTLKVIFFRFVQIDLEMWIIMPKKWGYEGTLHKWGFAGTIHMSPLCFVTYEINIDLLRLHTLIMNINILLKKWEFEGTVHKWAFAFTIVYHETHLLPL